MDDALKVRDFWFGRTLSGALPPAGGLTEQVTALDERQGQWFQDDADLRAQQDEAVRAKFQELVERAARGELAGWADSPRRRLSLIILLDQFPRQIYRGTPQAFAYDQQALALTLTGMQSAADGALNLVERLFFYMPMQHAEVADVQDESVAAFKRLVTECPPELKPTFENCLRYAEEHRDTIRRFGRFPARNQVLGRDNSAAETTWLRQHA